MLIRKYPLAKVLYESYCAAHDPESLQDWYVQEDDYGAQALHHVERAMAATTLERRQQILGILKLFHNNGIEFKCFPVRKKRSLFGRSDRTANQRPV